MSAKTFEQYCALREELDGIPGSPESEVGDMQVKGMLKKRINMLFQELEGYHITRQKAISLLSVIVKEFTQEFNLNPSALRTAMRQATTAPVNAPVPNENPMG